MCPLRGSNNTHQTLAFPQGEVDERGERCPGGLPAGEISDSEPNHVFGPQTIPILSGFERNYPLVI